MGISLNPATLLSGQGLDVTSVVSQIIASEAGPLTVWSQQQTTLASENGALDGINNDLANLQTAVQALADPEAAFGSQLATTSDGSVVAASADGTAIAGTHQIVVNSLATTGTLYSNPVAAGANTSFLASGQTTGDVKLQVGGTTGTTYDLPITAGSNDTLTTLASYINTQSTANDWGVAASVVTGATGSQLALQSQNTGSSGALAIVNNSHTTLSFATPEGGANASLTVDGQPFTSATDTVTGAIQGVTLSLLNASPGEQVQLTIAQDTSQVSSAVSNFISAYNSLVSDINAQYKVDPTGVIPVPPLESDISLRSVQSSILSDAAYSITGNGGLINLETLGINTANDGTLSLGTSATGQSLSEILATNPSEVQNFFQNASGTGFANNFATDLTNLTNPTTGPLNADIAQNTAENTDLTNSITNLQTQLAAQTTALTSQFETVNATLQAYPLLLQQVTETLGTLGSGTSSSGALVSSEPTLTSGL
ncbi:MAG: flagellar filament capping protein FliD [Candidatus Sulfotelmatobacter sp.]|jgi:flagellar hook-associated protein 2